MGSSVVPRRRRGRRIGSYAVSALAALAFVALATALHVGDQHWPAAAAAYLGVVAVIALTVGWRQAVFALLLGGLLADYLFIGPVGSLGIPRGTEAIQFAAFIMSGLAFSVAVGWRGARDRRRHAAQALRQGQLEAQLAADGLPLPESRLRVVYLDHCAALSGGEIALVRLLEALPGIDAHVVLAEDGPLCARIRERGIPVEVLPFSAAARNTNRNDVEPGLRSAGMALRTLRYSWRLSRRLRQLRPDLVHTNSLKSAVYGGLAARLAGIPTVSHLRDRLAVDYMSPTATRLMRLVLRVLPEAVIANSHSTMATLARSTSAVRISGAVAYDPVPAHIGDDASHGDRGLVVGMVGRISEWKGQDVFIDAFAEAFPDGGAHGVIVGSAMFGEDEYERRIHDQAAALKLGDRLEFTGFTDDVNGYLSRFDILVHASTVPEPFGQVVVEGMAAALPVVASKAGGPGEIITDAVDGLLFPPGDAHALAVALRRLADDADLRTALGTAARSKAAEFRPDRIAEQVKAVYRTVNALAAT